MHCTVHCTAQQCNAMECNVMQCDAMQWNAVQCNARQCKATCAFPSPCGPKHTQTKTAFITKMRNTKYTPPTSKMRNTKYTPPTSQDRPHTTHKTKHKMHNRFNIGISKKMLLAYAPQKTQNPTRAHTTIAVRKLSKQTKC